MRRRTLKTWAWVVLIGWSATAWVETVQLCYADIAQTLPAATQRTDVASPPDEAIDHDQYDEHCLKQPSQATDGSSGDLSPLAVIPTNPLWNDFVEQVPCASEAPDAPIAGSYIPAYFVAHRLRF